LGWRNSQYIYIYMESHKLSPCSSHHQPDQVGIKSQTTLW
jgi:hypothetical protein